MLSSLRETCISCDCDSGAMKADAFHPLRLAAGRIFPLQMRPVTADLLVPLKPAEKIDEAVGALFAFAFDLAVAHQAIEARPRFAIIAGANQPRNCCTGQPCPDRHNL
jgi:hypothetical protein